MWGYRRYFNEFRRLVRPFAGVTIGIADIPRIDGAFAAPAAGIVQYENDLYDGTAAFTFGFNGGESSGWTFPILFGVRYKF
jgi:hypothetical protein